MVQTPDLWVMCKLTATEDTNGPSYRVLGSWYGGYTGSDSWKMSSGVVSTAEFDDRYEFTNKSGSVYVCYKKSYGMSGFAHNVYNSYAIQNTPELYISIDEKYDDLHAPRKNAA